MIQFPFLNPFSPGCDTAIPPPSATTLILGGENIPVRIYCLLPVQSTVCTIGSMVDESISWGGGGKTLFAVSSKFIYRGELVETLSLADWRVNKFNCTSNTTLTSRQFSGNMTFPTLTNRSQLSYLPYVARPPQPSVSSVGYYIYDHSQPWWIMFPFLSRLDQEAKQEKLSSIDHAALFLTKKLFVGLFEHFLALNFYAPSVVQRCQRRTTSLLPCSMNGLVQNWYIRAGIQKLSSQVRAIGSSRHPTVEKIYEIPGFV